MECFGWWVGQLYNATLGDPKRTSYLCKPILREEIGGRDVDMVRDTGCKGIMMRTAPVVESKLTGQSFVLIKIDNAALLAEKAVIDLNTLRVWIIESVVHPIRHL
ncbi:hypothetical protein PoB_004254900 [Plakobranchus ocellatus]|uniref:Uncharacterized protein n=1 Tax=Plakobranchus ocellatus TaxID=259542 RepID=A0AAV4BBD0_9GAST|nr:hypothetical protein PoB_004254900 [Plakobranchus ocellatus]